MPSEIVVEIPPSNPLDVSITDPENPPVGIIIGDPTNPTHGVVGWNFGNGLNPITISGLNGEAFAPSLATTRRIILKADQPCDAVVTIKKNAVLFATMTLSNALIHDRSDITTPMSEGDLILFELVSVANSPHRLMCQLFVTRFT